MHPRETIPTPPTPNAAIIAAMANRRQADGDDGMASPAPEPQSLAEVPSLSSVARLRALLKQMEADLGLGDLSEHERDVLYAAWIASSPTKAGAREFTSDSLRSSEIADVIAPATFYRALKALRERGFMRFAEGRRRNHYTIEWGTRRPVRPRRP